MPLNYPLTKFPDYSIPNVFPDSKFFRFFGPYSSGLQRRAIEIRALVSHVVICERADSLLFFFALVLCRIYGFFDSALNRADTRFKPAIVRRYETVQFAC